MPDINDLEELEPLLKKIAKCGYDGMFSVEAYFPGFSPGYAQVIARLKEILNSSVQPGAGNAVIALEWEDQYDTTGRMQRKD